MVRHQNNGEKFYKERDLFLSFVKGYSELERIAQDSNFGTYSEIENIFYSLFPLREKPVPGSPDYITRKRDYFYVTCEDSKVSQDLSNYFLKDHGYGEKLYPGNDLGDFMSWICRQIIITNENFCYVDWEEKQLKNNKLLLPSDFDFLPVETMKVKRSWNSDLVFQQKYSWFTYLAKRRFKDWQDKIRPRVYNFKAGEIFYCRYPFSKTSSIKKIAKYLPSIMQFWMFGIHQGQANLNDKDHYWPIEKARFSTYIQEKRKHDLIKAKIAHAFSVPFAEPTTTRYYEVLIWIKYKKYLNDLRDYIVDEFNQQIFKQVKEKNNLPLIKLEYEGFVKNYEWDQVFQNYIEHKIPWDQLVKKIQER